MRAHKFLNNLSNKKDDLRIAKFLAKCGISSRRKCEQIILQGRAKINGEIIKDLSKKVFLGDKVEIDGKPLILEEKIVIALNKPTGYLSTVSDKFNRKTVLDLIHYKNFRLYPVGRLDVNSRGLIILTNDGELAYKLTHPKFGIPKVYDVLINKRINFKDLEIILNGIKIEGRELYPLSVDLLKIKLKNTSHDSNNLTNDYNRYKKFLNDSSLIRIKIAEGRKRIIRKVFKTLGYKVIDLKRVQIGNFKLDDCKPELSEGSSKILSNLEIKKLLRIS